MSDGEALEPIRPEFADYLRASEAAQPHDDWGRDHLASYAPAPLLTVPFSPRTATKADRFCLRLREALSIAGRVTVVGPPVRILMPPDPNPFPTMRVVGR